MEPADTLVASFTHFQVQQPPSSSAGPTALITSCYQANITHSSFILQTASSDGDSIQFLAIQSPHFDENFQKLQINATHNWFGSDAGPGSCCSQSTNPLQISPGIDYSYWSLVRPNSKKFPKILNFVFFRMIILPIIQLNQLQVLV